MTMNSELHPQADVDRLYVTREERGRGWITVKNGERVEEHSLSDRGQFRYSVGCFCKKKWKQELITE